MPFSGLRQFLTIEAPLKVLFLLKIFAFLSWYFGYIEKRLDKEVNVIYKIYDVTDWIINN